jgi:flagellar basal-body rod protein FlgB
MPGQNLFSDTMFAYQKVMDFRTQRHNLVSSNLTNAETPAYKAKDVEFERGCSCRWQRPTAGTSAGQVNSSF